MRRHNIASTAPCDCDKPLGSRTRARAWRGLWATFWLGARAWRGCGAGLSCSPCKPFGPAKRGVTTRMCGSPPPPPPPPLPPPPSPPPSPPPGRNGTARVRGLTSLSSVTETLPEKKIASIWEHVHKLAPPQALSLFDKPQGFDCADVHCQAAGAPAGDEHPWEAPKPADRPRTRAVRDAKSGPKPAPQPLPPGLRSITSLLKQAPKRERGPTLQELLIPAAKRRRA
eukprot:gene22151-biopygen13255